MWQLDIGTASAIRISLVLLIIAFCYRYDHYIFSGANATRPMSFDAHYRAYKQLWERVGKKTTKVTHCHRSSTPLRLQQANAADAQIAHLALWIKDTQHVHYQTLHSPQVLAKEAGFADERSYYLWRAELDPQKLVPDLWTSIFQDIDEQLGKIEEVSDIYIYKHDDAYSSDVVCFLRHILNKRFYWQAT